MDLDRDAARLFPGLGTASQRADWQALVRKAIKGADPAGLGQILYVADTAPTLPPLKRNSSAGWDIRTLATDSGAEQANHRILEDLQGGATSVLLALDPEDANRLAVASAADLGRALDGVLLDVAPVALDAGFVGPQAADWLAAVAKGGPTSPLAFHMDPLGAFARQGASPGPIQAHINLAADTAARHAAPYPKATAFLATGAPAYEAGGAPAQALGFALAAALAYAKAMTSAGLPLDQTFARIVLGVPVDGDYNLGIAAVRAARLTWRRLTQTCDVDLPARIEARSARRMLSARDAWTNLLRLTASGFAGAVGGADAVVLEPFTQPLGPPSALARRQARNIQILLMAEAGLAGIGDPAAGSWALDTLTRDLAQAAWAEFQAIEAEGGLLAALLSGGIAGRVAQTRADIQANYAEGKVILGANRHADANLAEPATGSAAPAASPPDPRLPGPDDHCNALAPIRWSAPFETGQ